MIHASVLLCIRSDNQPGPGPSLCRCRGRSCQRRCIEPRPGVLQHRQRCCHHSFARTDLMLLVSFCYVTQSPARRQVGCGSLILHRGVLRRGAVGRPGAHSEYTDPDRGHSTGKGGYLALGAGGGAPSRNRAAVSRLRGCHFFRIRTLRNRLYEFAHNETRRCKGRTSDGSGRINAAHGIRRQAWRRRP